MRFLPVVAVAACGLLLAACRTPPPPPVDPNARAALLRYDASKDGALSRAELDAGLAAEFAAADINRDGRLDRAETETINDARWRSSASRTSPIQDWNQDGIVDSREFGTEMRSLFDAMDLDRDGTISGEEFNPPNAAPPGRAGRGAAGQGAPR